MTAGMIEEWKLVLDFEDAYAVSNLGRIKSLQRAVDRTDGKPCMLRERILQGSVGPDGYRQITLRWAGKKKQSVFINWWLQLFFPLERVVRGK